MEFKAGCRPRRDGFKKVRIVHEQARWFSVWAGVKGRCPQCGKGKLFKGFISLEKECAVCGLSYDFADAGDGPAVFIIFVVGFLVIVGAILTEIFYRPPYWVHGLLWGPGVVLLSAGLLRPFKGVLIGLQYKHQAREGRIDQ